MRAFYRDARSCRALGFQTLSTQHLIRSHDNRWTDSRVFTACAHVEQSPFDIVHDPHISPTLHILHSEFTRKNEFRRICETLRLHQQQSYSRTSSSAIAAGLGQNAVAPVDPLARTIETRNYQMKVAIELGLWTVAFHTVEEMHFLLAKKRPSPAQLTSYYSNLAKILYQSSNAQQHQLFHAVCLLKLFNLSSTASADVLRPIADQATLAVLSAAVADSLVLAASEAIAPSGEGPENAIDFAAEKAARLSMLTGSGSVPTPQSLVSDLISKDILSHCSEGVRNLYSVLTDEASSTKESGWINARVPALMTALPAELKQYVPALSRLALVKITKDMQAMYSCIGFAKFESLTGAILDLPAAVRLLGQLKRTEQIDVAVDYSSGTISFGSSPSASSGVSAVAGAVATIHSAASKIRAEKSADSILERAHAILFDEDAFFARLDADRRRCDDRRNASDARKAALEQGAVRKAQELADQLRRAEEERLESDARARAAEAARREALAKKREEELVKTKAIVEKMTALGGAAEVAALTEDQLVGMGVAKLEQLQKEQFAKERQDRINKRRNESRRLEHTARLVRVAENEKITEWASTVYATDKEQFAQVAAERAEEWRKAAEAKKAAVNALLPFDRLLASWKTKQVEEFNKKVAIKAEERRARLTAQAAARKPGGDEEKESVVAPTSAMSRDEFKEMAKSLPSWKDASPVDSVE